MEAGSRLPRPARPPAPASTHWRRGSEAETEEPIFHLEQMAAVKVHLLLKMYAWSEKNEGREKMTRNISNFKIHPICIAGWLWGAPGAPLAAAPVETSPDVQRSSPDRLHLAPFGVGSEEIQERKQTQRGLLFCRSGSWKWFLGGTEKT